MLKVLTLVVSGITLYITPSYAEPLSVVVTGTQVSVVYNEPTQNVNDTPLVDLDFTSIYYDMGAGPVQETNVPATAPTGGGQITQQFIVPVQEGEEKDVTVWATATDISGNESEQSVPDTVRIDRLKPKPPS